MDQTLVTLALLFIIMKLSDFSGIVHNEYVNTEKL